MWYLLVCVLLVNIQYGSTRCANDCSLHGKCTDENECVCDSGFDVVADCSQSNCPYGEAWADKANRVNRAHARSECSNMGYCDGATGVCECFEGFEGIACERTSCNCHNHGVCQSTQNLYNLFEPATSANITAYSRWDGNRTTACVCDMGYTGASCDMRMCPKGDDPFST
ncbi:hypothetical protein B484DRAFT_335146, partial [Ochromonadaceae sp. CCMP2298]